jgi:hypothetical protein
MISLVPHPSTVARMTSARHTWRIERDFQELKQEIGLDHHLGPRLAQLPPSHGALDCGLRTPDLREESDSPHRSPTQDENYRSRGHGTSA